MFRPGAFIPIPIMYSCTYIFIEINIVLLCYTLMYMYNGNDEDIRKYSQIKGDRLSMAWHTSQLPKPLKLLPTIDMAFTHGTYSRFRVPKQSKALLTSNRSSPITPSLTDTLLCWYKKCNTVILLHDPSEQGGSKNTYIVRLEHAMTPPVR